MATIKFEASFTVEDETTEEELKKFMMAKLISNGFDCIEVKKFIDN